jgi:hypothetical protein
MPDEWPTLNSKAQLGAALLGQKKYDDAEPLRLAGYAGMKQRESTSPLPGRPRVKDALECLVQLYENTSRKDDAAKWRMVLEEFEGKIAGPVHDVGHGLKLHGRLDAKTRTLVYQVKRAARKTYVIDMGSPDAKALDPYLVLTDAADKALAEDDDSGGFANARIVYRATRDGTFRIRATSFNNGNGEFSLSVRELAKLPGD